jgi:hypothetical protein
VLIVFLDDPTASYCPSLIKSHFIRTEHPLVLSTFKTPLRSSYRLRPPHRADVVVLVRVEKRDENGNASHLRSALLRGWLCDGWLT